MPKGVLLLQKTHSTLKNETRWRDNFKAELFFHQVHQVHANKENVKKKFSDTDGKFLTLLGRDRW